jgi:hypothetical protein
MSSRLFSGKIPEKNIHWNITVAENNGYKKVTNNKNIRKRQKRERIRNILKSEDKKIGGVYLYRKLRTHIWKAIQTHCTQDES